MRRVAVVTGAGRGIGREIALRLARDGHAVAVNDLIHIDGAREVATEIRRLGGTATAYCADISSSPAVLAMFAQVHDDLGPVAILVNNAALTEVHKPWTDITEEEWDRVMEVNVKGCFLTARAAHPVMQERQWGRIINMSSVVARVGLTRLLHYTASKAAITGFTRTLARELAVDGITVNAVAPGAISTEAESNSVRDPDAANREVLAHQAIQRRGYPADVVGVVSFLASDDATFITGQTIAVDGGWAMR